MLFWCFIRSMWMHRNSVADQADAQEMAAIILRDLQAQLKTLYEEFETNSNIILSQDHCLFTFHTLDQ
jgi:hypothetical protein